MKIYLAGPIDNVSRKAAQGWRSRVKSTLEDSGQSIEVLDPMRHGEFDKLLDWEKIVRLDKLDIQAADIILVNYIEPSVGTSMEIMYAHSLGKPIVFVNDTAYDPSAWHIAHASIMVGTLDTAIRLLLDQSFRFGLQQKT